MKNGWYRSTKEGQTHLVVMFLDNEPQYFINDRAPSKQFFEGLETPIKEGRHTDPVSGESRWIHHKSAAAHANGVDWIALHHYYDLPIYEITSVEEVDTDLVFDILS